MVSIELIVAPEPRLLIITNNMNKLDVTKFAVLRFSNG